MSRQRRQRSVGHDRLVVVWQVTERCNLSCGFCAHDSRLPIARRQAEPARLLRFGRLLANYAEIACRPVHVSLLGGEPTLWLALSQVERELSALGLSLGITTNGTTLGSRRWRARLLSHYDEVTISVDGIGVVHDELRGHCGGFAALEQGIRRLVAEREGRVRPRVRVNSVLMRQTVAQFAGLCQKLAGWGVDEITFNELGGRDRPEYYPAHRLRAEDVSAFADEFDDLQRELWRHGVTLRGGRDYLERLAASARGQAWPVDDCRPGQGFLFVDPRGAVAPCSFTSREYSVSDDELSQGADIAALPQRFEAMRRRRGAPACEDCRSTRVFDKYAKPQRRSPAPTVEGWAHGS